MAQGMALLAAALAAMALFVAVRGAMGWARGRLGAETARAHPHPWPAARRLLRPLARRCRLWMKPGSLQRLQARLAAAGSPEDLAPEDLVALQVAGGAAGLLLGAATGRAGLAAAGALFGALQPRLWLRNEVRRRQTAMSGALPYVLDLLTLCVEAGLDFGAALAKVVEQGRPGPLQDELRRVLSQLRVGRTREEALRGLAARAQLPEVGAFVVALIQADRMGAPLGRVLRAQSRQLRNQRSQRAEKLANEAPVKLLVPLIAFIFPALFMVLFGPLVFRFFVGGLD